jgi:hypothetical protein
MEFEPVVLDGFEGREEALAQIKRYIHELTQIMFYRTDDLIHSRRVLWHLEEALPDIVGVYGNGFDVGFARTLALVHDDLEILTGDLQLHDKVRMTPEQREDHARKESDAIPIVVGMYDTVANGHDYKELLTAAKDKTCLEAQFVSFFDKFDGGGEAWHEVWAGNHPFLLPAGGSHGQKGGYVKWMNQFPSKYPAMAKFFEQFPHYLPEPFDFRSAAEQGRPHTAESLQEDSGYPPYEKWKRNVIEREGVELLVTQREFP